MGKLWNFYKKLFTRKNKDKQTNSDSFDLYAKGGHIDPIDLYAKGGHIDLYAKGGHIDPIDLYAKGGYIDLYAKGERIDHGKTTLTMLMPELAKKQRQGRIAPFVEGRPIININ